MKTRRGFLYTFIVLLICIISTGCKTATTTTKPAEDTSLTATVEAKSPEVSAEKGALRIVLTYSQNGDPVRSQNLYLAELRPLQGGTEGAYVPVLDTNTASNAESTLTGEVVMSLVTPGKYALAILTPAGAQIVIDSESNRELTLDIKAGEVTDLGVRKVVLDQEFLEPTIIP